MGHVSRTCPSGTVFIAHPPFQSTQADQAEANRRFALPLRVPFGSWVVVGDTQANEPPGRIFRKKEKSFAAAWFGPTRSPPTNDIFVAAEATAGAAQRRSFGTPWIMYATPLSTVAASMAQSRTATVGIAHPEGKPLAPATQAAAR